ncbi:MAG: amidohydrolase, partial [Alphaproteobacteria bacterium]|nr:amidohydrolase [Alphaproteobacteria bacterium]
MGGGEAAGSAAAAPPKASSEAPFASTYQRYPGRPTALVGATVYDGTGQRFDNATVLFRDGEVVEVGMSLATDGYDVIDGTGKFVTPGVIDIHSHLGDYPTPSVQAHSDGNEA